MNVLTAVELWPRRSAAEIASLARVSVQEAELTLEQLARTGAVYRAGRRLCSIQQVEASVWTTDPEDTAGLYHPGGIPLSPKDKKKPTKKDKDHDH